MTIKDLMIASLLFSLVFVGLFSFVGDMQSTYNFEIDQEYTIVYASVNSTLSNITDMTSNMQNKLENTSSTNDDAENNLWRGGWSAVRLIFKLPAITTSLINAMAVSLKLPRGNTYFWGAIAGLVIITVVFSIIGAIMRKDL